MRRSAPPIRSCGMSSSSGPMSAMPSGAARAAGRGQGGSPRRRSRRRPEHVRDRPLRLGQRSRHGGAVSGADRPARRARGRRIVDEHLRRGPLSDARRPRWSRMRERPQRRRACRALGPARCGRRAAEAGRHAGKEAPEPRLGLCHDEIRAGTADAHRCAAPTAWRAWRCGCSMSTGRVRRFQSLYRRARDLRLAPAERRAAAGLRGWRAAARLRACRGRGTRLRAGAGGAGGRGRSSTSAAAATSRIARSASARRARWAGRI